MNTNAILGLTIPLGLVFGAAVSFVVFYLGQAHDDAMHPRETRYGGGYEPFDRGVAAFNAALGSVFWPLTLPLFLAYLLAARHEPSADGLSRKQQATLKFERERANIAKEAAQAQREWERLLRDGL